MSAAARHDHSNLTVNKFGRKRRQSIILVFRPAIFDRYVWPSTYPASFSPWRKARRRIAYSSGDALLRKPITGSDCCARKASGHVAATPPKSLINSRRLMAAP
jgi:hypothetical protein